jgi:hypothetical protein
MKKITTLFLTLSLASCYNVERNCKDFKTGIYKTDITINGVKKQTVSERTESMVIETYEGKTDTASIRWINDCEYVLQQLHPKNRHEKQAIDIKILTTSKNSYTFEFGVVGSDKKMRGTATRL